MRLTVLPYWLPAVLIVVTAAGCMNFDRGDDAWRAAVDRQAAQL
jgi:hypothetical protein